MYFEEPPSRGLLASITMTTVRLCPGGSSLDEKVSMTGVEEQLN